MADITRHYVITLENNTGGQNKSAVVGADTNTGGKNGQGNNAKKIISGTALYAVGKQLVFSTIGHQIDTYALRTGRNEAQAKQQFYWNVAKQAFSIGESIIAGAMVGGGIGAVVGATIGIGMTAYQYMQKADTIQKQATLESINLQFAQRRAGIGGSRELRQGA